MAINKHLLPVFDKPMICHSLSILLLMGIREIGIITSSRDQQRFKDLLGDGSHIGISISWLIQDEPRGIPDAFIIGEEFLDDDPSCLALGDTLMHGSGLSSFLNSWIDGSKNARLLCYYVDDARPYGVAKIDPNGRIKSLQEKPAERQPGLAVTGVYCFDSDVCELAKMLPISARGEIEIVDLCQIYLERQKLDATVLGRGVVWLDLGSPENLLDAANYIHVMDVRQQLKIGCIEEICWRKGWIDDDQLSRSAERYGDSPYANYLKKILETSA
jgi:glucose-1-phosphate thymidylyltransferase